MRVIEYLIQKGAYYVEIDYKENKISTSPILYSHYLSLLIYISI